MNKLQRCLVFCITANEIHPTKGRGWKSWANMAGKTPREPKRFWFGIQTDKGTFVGQLPAEYWHRLHFPQHMKALRDTSSCTEPNEGEFVSLSGITYQEKLDELLTCQLNNQRPCMEKLGLTNLWPQLSQSELAATISTSPEADAEAQEPELTPA